MENWTSNEVVGVSICCITYKQENYISQAIDGFLMQKTFFPFEIIIGEDCGKDSTLDILYEYKDRYPNIIKIVTSEENVGANANLLRVFNEASGKYIAICEGDDYWVDENKIQNQYSLLELNRAINIIFTAAKTLDYNGNISSVAKHSRHGKTFNISEVIRGGGGFMPTASIMFRKSVIELIPGWFVFAPIGDFYIQILGALKGGALFLPGETVMYRLNSINSWSSTRQQLSKQTIMDLLQKLSTCADGLSVCGVDIHDINYMKAAHETDASVQLLKNGYFTESKLIIMKSWRTKKHIGKMQCLIYFTRFFPKITAWLIK